MSIEDLQKGIVIHEQVLREADDSGNWQAVCQEIWLEMKRR
jgi:hypothetical protein